MNETTILRRIVNKPVTANCPSKHSLNFPPPSSPAKIRGTFDSGRLFATIDQLRSGVWEARPSRELRIDPASSFHCVSSFFYNLTLLHSPPPPPDLLHNTRYTPLR